MTSNGHGRSLVVIQLSGGNDYLNTLVPYNEGLYYDYRPAVNIEPEQVLKVDDQYGFRPGMEPVKRLWDEGKVAIVNGIGYPNPNRSHFRSMDIWHTAMPEDIGNEGWLGRAIRELDPKGDNVLTGVNFGRGLPPRAGVQGSAGGLRGEPRDLRPLPGHGGRGAAQVRAGDVRQDVRWGPRR